MKKLLFLSGVFLLLLAACSSNESSKEHNSKSKTEQSKKDKKVTVNTGKLSEKEKLALAFCIDDVDQYTLTKNEILTGIYSYKLPTGTRNYRLVDFMLVKVKQPIENAPKGMHFYTVQPDKGNFKAIIGVNKDKIFVGRMPKKDLDYNDLIRKGKEVKLADVYTENRHNKALPELNSKINIVDTVPKGSEDDGNPLSSKNLEKSGSVNAHYRNEVYQLISDFEDVPVSKTNYLWDDVKMTNHRGDWVVNYRNKDGEILGTYKMKNGKIIKLDSNGKVVKKES
ncbi:hypothetical protein HYI43_00690 [Staphylococcus taiwanensis]|nr:hypothetical protein HYI43_00690 [Staphylococcus taiwanensis]